MAPRRLEQLGGRRDGAGGVDHVVGEHAQPALDIADDLGRLGHVGGALGPALVAERQVGAAVTEVLGHPLGDLDAPGVRRHDHRRRAVLAQVPLEHRDRREVVDRSVEEALDLTGVEVDRDHPLGAGGLEHVGDQPGRDRLATLGLAVLAGVAVERRDGGDALRRRPVGGVAHDQLLHDRVVDRAAVDPVVGLQDEDVVAADALGEPGPHLAVGELDEVRVPELDPQVLGDLGGELRMGPPRVQRQLLGGDLLHRRPAPVASPWWRSVERAGLRALGDVRPRRQVAVRPDLAPVADLGLQPDRVLDAAVPPDDAVVEPGVRPDLTAVAETVLPSRIVPGYSVTSRPSRTVTSMNVWRGRAS